VEQNKFSNIKHVIGVVSGKGGVGKSMVTASLANMMASQGYSVGILDADITGPSIPKMYGLHGPAPMAEECIQPIYTKNGIRVMSINLLLEDEEAPVIWRGPILANMVKQFWSDVAWGEIDYLFVDMPPGTGDVPLTVFQSIPVEGILVVTSPQDLVRLIVKKALNMAGSMKIPVLGLIENYSYVVCPDCGKEFKIFGESEIDALSEELNIPVLGKMPIDTKLAELADGAFDQAENEYLLPAENRLMFL
jgi:Mrp family chromosome partitioning ATPase